ncbi:MAG: helix-hairpin-helix domain-containing protein [Methyloversatilis sp.]|nr:helix-hairpin-helix domain-containing protein [Methyloversatilis sp.]MBP6194792.1 helix-hairpin-helix domain-containing protein [Methyloversatilis sp.]MBP9118788.1 helix-hairpin-helix domain-containing protein [Methyloversatilis sp.]
MRHLICVLLLSFASPFAIAALDLNTATEAELDALPGVGPSRAQAIIEYRRTHGDFASVDDLGKVKGIGEKTLAELKPLLTAGSRGAAAQTPSAPVGSGGTASSGFPWWMLIAGVVVAVVAFVIMRRRSAPVPTRPLGPASSPSADGAAEPESAPIAAPASVSKSAPPRPAASAPAQAPVAPAPTAPSPAGAPPRPAGGPPAPAQAASSEFPSASAPKPAGALPKPAGSR